MPGRETKVQWIARARRGYIPSHERRPTPEHVRLQEARDRSVPWKKWGPYLSERQWGTVREDYSASGLAWDYFPRPGALARLPVGEDGLAGFSDDKQRLCFAIALWNGKDPILKERLFGLANSEGNHGEDVKEYYFYLDSTPTHSYMKYLLQVPAAGLSVQPAGGHERKPRTPGRTRVRADRHRRLRRRPVLRRVRRIRERRRRRKSSSESASGTAGRKRPPCTFSPRSGSGTRGRGPPDPRSRRSPPARAPRERAWWPRPMPSWARATCTATAPRRSCSRRTRPTPGGSSASPRPRPT